MKHAITQSRTQFFKSENLHFCDSYFQYYFSLYDSSLRRKACDTGIKSHLLYFLLKPTLSISSTIVGFFFDIKTTIIYKF